MDYSICKKCIEKNESLKWYPTPISTLDSYLQKLFTQTPDIKHIAALRKNLAYNIQYIEFQINLIKRINTSSVILTQNWKNMIITGVSIIETFLYYILISKNLIRKTNWNETPDIKIEQHKKIEGVNYRIQNLLFKKNIERYERISFDAMIKIVSEKKMLGVDIEIYRNLNYLKKLRNKVHLHLVEKIEDTDWNSFNHKEILILQKSLYAFLTSSYLKPTPEEKSMFKFLLP